jgi:hypothetical protein
MKLRASSVLLLSATTLILAGCGGNQFTPTAAANIYLDAAPFASGLYQPQILDYPPTGTSAPTILSALPSTSTVFVGIATDASGRTYTSLYNTHAVTSEILVYAPGATGSTPPIRAFSYGQMTLPIHDITVDPKGNVYAVDIDGDLFEFGPNASGLTVPLLSLSGIYPGSGITTDSSGNLYLSVYPSGCSCGGSASIYVYNAGFNSLTPSHIITPPVAEYIDGLAVDASDNLYASGELSSGTGAGRIDVYAPGASGNATPLRTITGSSTLLAGSPAISAYNTLAIDDLGDLYTRSIDTAGSDLSVIHEFSPTASGNVAPTTSITTTLTGAGNYGIAVY